MKLLIKENPFVQGKFVLMNEQGTHILGTHTGMPFSDNQFGINDLVRYYESKDSTVTWHAFIPIEVAQEYYKTGAAKEKKNQAAKERRERKKRELANTVLAQIMCDVETNNLTALKKLIKAIPKHAVEDYLPEELLTTQGE